MKKKLWSELWIILPIIILENKVLTNLFTGMKLNITLKNGKKDIGEKTNIIENY